MAEGVEFAATIAVPVWQGYMFSRAIVHGAHISNMFVTVFD